MHIYNHLKTFHLKIFLLKIFPLKTLLFACILYLIPIIIPGTCSSSDQSATHLKIGIYDNPPKLFVDENNEPKGIFPGILNDIAQKEGWEIKFIPLSFKDGLKRLEKGSIDIMQDVAWSKKRSRIYGFTNETVMVSWGRVYKKKGLDISTLIDLDNKRIAYMDGGIYSEGPDGLKTLMKKFELNADFIPVNGYKQVFEYIDQGKADVGVANRLYGKTNTHKYHIENTPILISPISIRLAFNKSNPATTQLIKTIDEHMIRFKADENSIYYQLIDEYIGRPRRVIPPIFKTLLAFLLLLLAVFAILGVFLSRQSQKKSAQLIATDKALKESEKKFRTIFENLQDVYFEADLSGAIHTLTPSVEKTLGFQAGELNGLPIKNIFEQTEDYDTFIKVLLEEASIRDFQALCIKKDQDAIWVSINADLYQNEMGTKGIRGILRDITQQKNTEKKLIERKERFREMARLLPCGIVETDRHLNITYANKTGLDMFGYTNKDLKAGLNGKDIILSDLPGGIDENFTFPLEKDTIAPAEYEMKKKDGTSIIVLLNLNPIQYDNQVSGFRASLVDLTEFKKLQEEAIRNQKLESTGILAGGIAHDFNNILLGLFGNITLAKSELPPENTAYKLIEEAEKSMTRAKDLTTQLLTFAQGGDPIKQAVTIDQVIQETAAFNLAGSNIKIAMEKPENLWQVSADKSQISQVISNLVINARQAMPDGGSLNIKIENTALSENDFSTLKLDQYVKISITDEGEGIAEMHLEKVFDPYFTTKKNGSGLGLAIVHSIILKHHGYIYVNSTLGQGTTFVIYLPIDTSAPVQRSNSTENIITVEAQHLSILVMDDDALVREVSERILNKLGHSATLCDEGGQAIELYEQAMEKKTPYDIIIMDLTIPGGMGGQEAVKQLLEIDSTVISVVASGYSTDPVMANYKEYGFKAMITKPYTLEKMQQVIDQAIHS